MNEEKYYTPTIDEFHVGFEYEYRRHGSDYDWEPAKIMAAAQIADIHASYRGERVYDLRVKRLDHDDILQCGWENTLSDEAGPQSGSYMIGNRPNYFLLGHYSNGVQIKNARYEMLFNGHIRNKSELQRIMKMVGINTEKV